jgi:cytochrome c553
MRLRAIALLTGTALITAALGLRSGAVQAQMLGGNIEAGREKAQVCAACHGPDGTSTNPAVPSIAGQPPLYTYYQLIQFKNGRRASPQMAPFVTPLTDDDMQDLAAYYAAQAPKTTPQAFDATKAEVGKRVASTFHCTSCHRPDLSGQNQIPRLTGLSRDYLVTQLRGYKAQTRADTDLSMTMSAQTLTDEDIENLAHYIVSLIGH